MKARFFAKQLQHSMIALAFLNLCATHALAQKSQAQPFTTHQHELIPDQSKASALLKVVRESTERF